VFNLGRWVVVGALWGVLVIVVLTVPDVNNSTAYTTAGAPVLGALWWLLVLRRRLNAGTAGPPDLVATRARGL
jgi:hypothetical protein